MSKKAMKLALEALENSIDAVRHEYETDWRHGMPTREAQLASMKMGVEAHEQAITAIKEALAQPEPEYVLPGGGYVPPIPLAQPEQEPVAWMDGYRNIYSLEEKAAGCPEATIALVPMANHEKTSGSPIKELNCICGAVWEGDELVHLPRPPAQRKPLTDDEIWREYRSLWPFHPAEERKLASDILMFARAIEAAHKIKENT